MRWWWKLHKAWRVTVVVALCLASGFAVDAWQHAHHREGVVWPFYWAMSSFVILFVVVEAVHDWPRRRSGQSGGAPGGEAHPAPGTGVPGGLPPQ